MVGVVAWAGRWGGAQTRRSKGKGLRAAYGHMKAAAAAWLAITAAHGMPLTKLTSTSGSTSTTYVNQRRWSCPAREARRAVGSS